MMVEKVAEYEELFKDRYTDKDEGYRQALQRGSRWYQVPVMSPWPPVTKGSRGRRDDEWDARYGRRTYHREPPDWDRRDYPRYPRWRMDCSPPPPGYSDWHPPPPPYDHWPPPPHLSHLPPPPPPPYHIHRHHRSRSPNYPPSPPSPAHHQHYHRHHFHQEEPEWEKEDHGDPNKPQYSQNRREDQSSTGDHSQDQLIHHPSQETDSESQRATSDSDTNPKEKQGADLSIGYPLQPLGEETAAPPSESDVMAILSSASRVQNKVTSENLKKAQRSATKLASKQGGRKTSRTHSEGSSSGNTSKRETSLSTPSVPKSSSSQLKPHAGLQIKHGKPQSVTVSLLGLKESSATPQPFYSSETIHRQPVKRKRKATVIPDDSEESENEIDPVTVDTEPAPSTTLPGGKMSSTFYGAAIAPTATNRLLSGQSPPSSLMVHINNRLFRLSGGEEPSPALPSHAPLPLHQEPVRLDQALPAGEEREGAGNELVLTSSKPKKKKKKHKKKSKLKGEAGKEEKEEDEEEENHEKDKVETTGVKNDGLKLRIIMKQ